VTIEADVLVGDAVGSEAMVEVAPVQELCWFAKDVGVVAPVVNLEVATPTVLVGLCSVALSVVKIVVINSLLSVSVSEVGVLLAVRAIVSQSCPLNPIGQSHLKE
jgi:hypothetical protein